MEASILILFIAMQAGFSRLDFFIEHRFATRLKGKHWVVWLVHPNVLKGGHDFVIFIAAELPKAFGH